MYCKIFPFTIILNAHSYEGQLYYNSTGSCLARKLARRCSRFPSITDPSVHATPDSVGRPDDRSRSLAVIRPDVGQHGAARTVRSLRFPRRKRPKTTV